MTRLWIFLVNTFNVVTRTSFRKMLLISSDHFSKLEAEKDDPDIAKIIEDSIGSYNNYEKSYTSAKANLGMRKGKTQIFTELMTLFHKTWLPAWEVRVMTIYPKGTPEFNMIFPEKRAAFQSAAYDEILLSITTFAAVLDGFPEFKDLATEVREKTTLLKNARVSQGSAKGKSGLYSDELEQRREELAAALYGNLGALMRKFQNDPVQVQRFFKLSLLRKSSTNDGGITLLAKVTAGGLTTVEFPKDMVVNAETTYTLANQSPETSIWAYFAPNASVLDGDPKLAIGPNESVEATATDLGWDAEKPLLLVRNIGVAAAEVEVTVYLG